MGLGELITKLFEPCRSAPKSPPCPSPERQKIEAKASANASDKTIVEVLPCGEITNTPGNTDSSGSPKPKPTHAEGFAVNQVKMGESKPSIMENQIEDARSKLILEAFGFEVQRMLASKAWDDRAQGLAAAREKCEQRDIPSSMEESQFIDACCKLVLVSLQDKVMPIYFEGLELTKYLFGELAQSLQGCKEVIKNNLEELLPVIIAKTADRNARSNEGTRNILTFLARCQLVGCSPVMAHIFTPIVNFKEISSIRGRLELIDHVIQDFGFGKASTITMQLVMGFVRPHLDATDEKVRRAAIEVTVSCYKHKGERTLKYITNVKPALLKLLQQRFAELDKPAKGARKHAKSAQGLPAVRGGKGRKRPPIRESASQPVGNASDGFFKAALPSGMSSVNFTEEPTQEAELSHVLRDCPQLFSMGGNAGANTMVMSPLSSQAAPSNSLREDPNFVCSPSDYGNMQEAMPGAMPGAPSMGGYGNDVDLEADLDADLMNEIEAY